MEGANADSDHSMTWEDFFGSTTDLAPTLIELYDSLLDKKSHKPDTSIVETAKDARNNPPLTSPLTTNMTVSKFEEGNTAEPPPSQPNHTNKPASVQLPIATVNKSSLYSIRTKSDFKDASVEVIRDLNTSDKDANQNRTLKEVKQTESSFDNLSPNVRRMLSSASETPTLKFQKKTTNTVRSSTRHKSNIPLMGATSKISQSGVEILSSVDIYDQPCVARNFAKSKSEEIDTPPRSLPPKAEFKLNEALETYDVPTNNRPAIYDVPNQNTKTAFELLSLPYIDQSIELSASSNDREFDTKLSPHKPDSKKSSSDSSPAKFPKPNRTCSLNRKDFNKSDSPSKQLNSTEFPNEVGSVGNLKSAIPEKEVIRLNPQIADVVRPLSMSSIASSSSTSSSGVQNKGGVNSAYLASIESLDDQSDADLTSANANKFRRTEDGPIEIFLPRQQEQDELSGLSPLERVCAEIIQTENVYVEDLRQVIEGYLHIWRHEATFSEEELSEVFNNIEDIYAFNRSLCDELNACQLDASCIARCFVDNTDGFSVYANYCTGYPRTMSRLALLAAVPSSALQFRERQAALGHALPLASYLLKPVQRLLKYHLLLQNVVKQCASGDTRAALLRMTEIARHVDDMKRRHEHAVRVQEIQSLLYGWNGPDLTTYGELCAEGTFRVFGAKAMRHVFLFDKLLLVTKNREDGILAYKTSIMCNNLMLVESLAGAPLCFQVIPWDAPRDQLTLTARSHRHKREWTLLLKRVILENYNAVIPSHARQLVMELGQNKTDDDILAEKSHNLITQASMRKQLSAPEYLEKRKLERDRRKTCENNLPRGTFKKNTKLSVPLKREINHDCDCSQYSAEKGIDYTCDNCYVDLCSDCEIEISNKNKEVTFNCKHEDNYDASVEKCPDCDKALHYIDAGSSEQMERRPSLCKCSDFKSSQESFDKEQNCSLNKTRGYHSSDNIIGYVEKSKDDLNETNSSLNNIRNIPKTCLKCEKIKENIVTDTPFRKSRCADNAKSRIEGMRSKSRDDPQRSKLLVIGTWRRKSEPGLQQNCHHHRKTQDSDNERSEKIEFECRNCGSTKISRKAKNGDALLSDPETENRKSNMDVRVYTTKNIPKKISKIRKNRAKGFRLGSDVTAKFYTDLSTDVSTENILHISESNDSLNVDQPAPSKVPVLISKDEDIDEETYKKLIEKTDSFKKNELEKVKYLNKQKVIKEGSEQEEKSSNIEEDQHDNVSERCEETEQPLEHIISQLLLQNRDFQMLLKKQQQRNSAHRRHQRLLKSHSNPEPVKSIEERANGKFLRQSSENAPPAVPEISDLPSQKEDVSDDDHIYETLRVEPRVDESLHNLDSKSKTIQHSHNITRPKRLQTPPNVMPITSDIKPHSPRTKMNVSESDYVYLSFEKLNQIKIDDTVYDVPVPAKSRLEQTETDYYEAMQHQGPPISPTIENVYDNVVEVCRRTKETPNTLTTEYLPMSPDQQSPNAPEIWVNRQKEHFNVSRDRKSGSLPRSFQVPVSSQDDASLSSFKTKPQTNSKTYLNRDGKVLSMDRPYTIASDQSEISYDDMESYMSEGDVLKFNKSPTAKDVNFSQELTKSTLELEEEIDRCYKNNFEKNRLEDDKNKNILGSNSNLNTSVNSSCEEQNDDQAHDDLIVHPEHKIYKPTSNLLSLKNVLSRFKNRTSKPTEELEINANDQSSPDSAKCDIKSPTNEKRSALNPKNYSKNLLQRFRSIIGEEHSDGNHNKTTAVKSVEALELPQKSEIKVVITSTDTSPTTSTIVYTINTDSLTKSVFGNTTITDSQHEKSKLDVLSQSCDNITNKKENLRHPYAKSHSLTTSYLKDTPTSPSRSGSSKQSLNNLPMYMLGSENLGARIASTEYADPIALEKSSQNVNTFINKNSVRPDSLFSISSFVTSSSEGTSQDNSSKSKHDKPKEKMFEDKDKNVKSNENYYEMKFEKLEQFKGSEIFRDSAVYSDQEESEELKTETSSKNVCDIVAKVENIQRSASVRLQKATVTSQAKMTVINNKISATESRKSNTTSDIKVDEVVSKPKVAPPVPAKPKVTQIPTTTTSTRTLVSRTNSKSFIRPTIIKNQGNATPAETVNTKVAHKNASMRIPKRTESTMIPRKSEPDKVVNDKTPAEDQTIEVNAGNIQMKRMSFERASLDSATRRIKATTEVNRLPSLDSAKTTKSVLERRMEIEEMAKKETSKPAVPIKKPSPLPVKPVKTFDRSVREINKNDSKPATMTNSDAQNISKTSISINDEIPSGTLPSTDPKESWVKQVVNKFQ